MNSLKPLQNIEPTGDWVSNGLLFVLVDAPANELARSAARANCSGPLLDSVLLVFSSCKLRLYSHVDQALVPKSPKSAKSERAPPCDSATLRSALRFAVVPKR
jgi:hypothetical protein